MITAQRPEIPLSTMAITILTEAYRLNFPHLSSSRYYNHAAVSPLSKRVMQAMNSMMSEWHEGEIENYLSRLIPLQSELRQRLARLLGCMPAQVAFVQNTSSALAFLAQGLSWSPGDRILLHEHDFPSTIHPFLALREKGVEIDFLPYSEGCATVSLVESGLRSKTRLVALSHVHYRSGFRIDVPEIAALCQSKGVLLSLDAIQALGAFPIHFNQWGIDFLAAGAHKWGMSPMGTGVMILSPALRERMGTPFRGWLSVASPWEMTDIEQPLHQDAKRYELGTYNWLGLAGMNEAFTIFEEVGLDRIAAKLALLNTALSESLKERGYQVCTSQEAHHRSGIISVKGIEDPEAVVTRLKHKGVHISERGGWVRFSPHFYNSVEEMYEAALHFDQTVNETS